MLGPRFSTAIKWVTALGLVGVLAVAAQRVHQAMRGERALEGSEEIITSPDRVKDGIVELSADSVERYGLKDEPARAAQWRSPVTVYGQVVPNPRATLELRAPLAGTMRAANAAWPALGQWVRAGQTLGWLDIRVGTQERLAMLDNLNSSRLKKQGAQKVVQIQQERVDRLQKAAQSEIVSRQLLDDAQVLLAEARTQFAIAVAAADLWQQALDDIDRPDGRKSSVFSQPLRAPGDGEVTEAPARPGMAIEAGGLLLQTVDFRQPLVRLDVPAALGPPPRVQLFAQAADTGFGTAVLEAPESTGAAPPVDASLVGPAPRVDAASQLAGYYYAVAASAIGLSGKEAERHSPRGTFWRPGLLVKAHLHSGRAEARAAVAVPAGAVLFHQGRPLIYVRLKPEEYRYQRVEVRLLGRDSEHWLLEPRQAHGPRGIAPTARVVTHQAQVLLSEEFRPKSGAAEKTTEEDDK